MPYNYNAYNRYYGFISHNAAIANLNALLYRVVPSLFVSNLVTLTVSYY